MRRALWIACGIALVDACAGPPPPPPPTEPQPAYLLEGTVYTQDDEPLEGITVRLFPVSSQDLLGSTRSDSSGSYRIEVLEPLPPGRLLVLLNSNRHVHHDGRFLPFVDRVSPPADTPRQRRAYYLTPSSEAGPPKGEVYVIKPLCNVRAAPTQESPVVGQVKRGQALRVLRRDGEWFWVELKDGTRGWIYRMLVTTLDHRMPE